MGTLLLVIISMTFMVDTCSSQWEPRSFHGLIGMTGEAAKEEIRAAHPTLFVIIVPPGTPVTMDHRLDRVRIFVDAQGLVDREPYTEFIKHRMIPQPKTTVDVTVIESHGIVY